ncbi:MAG: hypothetical protein B6247_03995 [Candidatus Parabeggiatoa sp. nov. 2]|nr:MAG: hypothetical protein B6247_03995 [Beggiatoa sp. 4572_84]
MISDAMINDLPLKFVPDGTDKIEIQENNSVSKHITFQSVIDLIIPVGMTSIFAGSIPPPGWLLCDNREISRDEYSRLFAVIGTRFGEGDKNATFNLPKLANYLVKNLGGMILIIKY